MKETNTAQAPATPTSSNPKRMATPKKGDKFHCDGCGMEIAVTADCHCKDHVRFECCGQEMHKV